MVERSRGRNSRQELNAKARQECSCLLTQTHVSYFKPTGQGEDATHGGLGTPVLIIKTIPHRHGHKTTR